MPGMAASTRLTWVLGSPPNVIGAPENNLLLAVTWAWTSSPMTISHLPVDPSIIPLISRRHDLRQGREGRRFFQRRRAGEDRFLVERAADQLETQRQPARVQTRRHRD